MVNWEFRAGFYDLLFNLPFFQGLRDSERRLFKKLVSESSGFMAVLDIGCGTGDYIGSSEGRIKIGMDLSFKMLQAAKERCPKAFFVIGDANHLPFKEGSFDFASAVGLLEYFEDQNRILGEINRILKDDATCILSFSRPTVLNAPRRLWGPRIFLNGPEDIERLLEKGGFLMEERGEALIQTQLRIRKRRSFRP